MLATIALIPIALSVAVKLSGAVLVPGSGAPFLDRVSHNGLFVAFTATVLAIPLFLPLTIAVVAGDTIAGEASAGTLRYLLIAPVNRVRLLVVKYLSAAVFAAVAVTTLLLTGLLVGSLLFPVGPVTLLSGNVIPLSSALLRVALIDLYVTVSLLGLSALGLFLSTLTVVPVGAMAATVIVSTVMQILGSLPQVTVIHPVLVSYYWLGFADVLRNPLTYGSLMNNVLLQACYIAIFGAFSYTRFSGKDILT